MFTTYSVQGTSSLLVTQQIHEAWYILKIAACTQKRVELLSARKLQ